MTTPVKLIYTFKNQQNTSQSVLYVFMGETDKTVLDIIESLGKKDLAVCLKNISKRNREIMEEEYGTKWYNYFFTDEHLQKSNMVGGNENNEFDILGQLGNDREDSQTDLVSLKPIEPVRKENTKIQSFIDTLKNEKTKNSLRNIKFNEELNDVHKDTNLSNPIDRIIVTHSLF